MSNWHEITCKQKAKHLFEKDVDHWFCGTGEEGAGKTSLAIWDAIYTSWHDFKINWKERITYDVDAFLMQLDNAPKGATVLLDEGAEAIYKRDFNQTPNKSAIKASTQVREKNLNIGILAPDKELLDSAVLRRFRTWFEVEMFRNGDDIIRGFSEFYSPHPRKFNKLKEPFWNLEIEHRFPALPSNIYEPYRKVKELRSHERRLRYIKQTVQFDELRETSTDIVIKKVKAKLRSGCDASEFKNSRGNWDWMKIRYLTNSDEVAAKTAAKFLPSKTSELVSRS